MLGASDKESLLPIHNFGLTKVDWKRVAPMPELLPFAAGLTRYWSDRRLHACEAPT